MRCLVLIVVGVLACLDACSAADGASPIVPPQDSAGGWYKPGYFDHSTFYLAASSHNDIAYLDDPRGTADFRSESLILPALDLMNADASFCLDIETTLYLKEFLQRHPVWLVHRPSNNIL